MIPFFYFLDNWFLGDKNNINLNNLFQKLFCSPWKVPISTRIILRNTIKRSRMFNQLLLTQNVQISIVFLSVKSIIMEIKESTVYLFYWTNLSHVRKIFITSAPLLSWLKGKVIGFPLFLRNFWFSFLKFTIPSNITFHFCEFSFTL